MAGDIKGKYGAHSQAIACTFASTASQHGRLSDAIDNSSDCFQEVLLAGKVKSGTSPSGNKQITVFGLGSADNGATYTDGYAAGDADSAVVPVNARPIIEVSAPTTGTVYPFGPIAVSPCFGGEMPALWMLNVFNDHGVTAFASGHGFWLQGKYSQYT